MKLNVSPLVEDIERYIAKANKDLEEQLDEEGYVATDVAVATINEIEDEITEALIDNCDDVLNRLQEATGLDNFIDDVWPTIKDEDDLKDTLVGIVQDKFDNLLQTCVQQFLVDADKELGFDGRITKPAQNFIESWSEQLASIMDLNTKDQIESILLESQEKAMSIVDVAKAIADSGIREPGYRARRVAVTEVLRVESYSQLEYMRQDPSVEEKEWFHTGSHKNKPRPNHVAISGQRVPKDQPFTLVGADGATYSPMCPRDTCLPASESVNCHCIMRTVRSKEKMGMTVEERRELRKKYMDEVDAEWDAKMAAEQKNQIKWPEKGEKISSSEFKDVMKYAKEKGVRLSGFKQFDGDIQTVKDIVDDVDQIAKDFPLIKEGKRPVTIMLDDIINPNEFASTDGHIISINANAFRNTKRLEEEYQKLVDIGWFVKGTDYRSVIRHETGHVVANKYELDGFDAVKAITGVSSDKDILAIARKKLSDYASEYDDGREIISEAFSGAYSSGEKNEFALQIIEYFGIIQEKE